MRKASAPLDQTDRRIITALQSDFPLSPRPFADAAASLGLEEGDLIARIKRMREDGAITRFGPFLDAAAMGGAFCLCAMAVPGECFDTVADQVNAHPEVAHNYARDHGLNMWFVLATETETGIEEAAEGIQTATGLKPFYRLPETGRSSSSGFRVAA